MNLPFDPSPLAASHPKLYALIVIIVLFFAGWHFLGTKKEKQIDKKIARLEEKSDKHQAILEQKVRDLTAETGSLRQKLNELHGYYKATLDERDALIGRLHRKDHELKMAYQHIEQLEQRVALLERRQQSPNYHPTEKDFQEIDELTASIMSLRK